MTRRLRLFLPALAACVGLTLLTGASLASGASLSVDGKDTTTNAFTVSYSGTADRDSIVTVEVVKDGTTCPSFPGPAGGRSVGSADVPAGPFSGVFSRAGLEGEGPGRYLVCAQVFARGASSGMDFASAQDTLNYTVDDGVRLKIGFTNRLDLFNSPQFAYGINCNTISADGVEGGCTGADKPGGTVTVTISETDRKRLKLPSRRLLAGDVRQNGDSGSHIGFVKATTTVKRLLRKRNDEREGRSLNIKAVVVYKATAPFRRTYTDRITLKTVFGNEKFGRCETTSTNLPCNSTNPATDGRG